MNNMNNMNDMSTTNTRAHEYNEHTSTTEKKPAITQQKTKNIYFYKKEQSQ
jgi:hypothetical protein